MSDVAERVKKIVVEHLGVDEASVTEEASFIDLGADSLDVLELVMAFEDEFGCEIPDAVAEKIVTVKDAVGFIQGSCRLAGEPAPKNEKSPARASRARPGMPQQAMKKPGGGRMLRRDQPPRHPLKL